MKVLVEKNIYLESDKSQFILNKYSGNLDKKGNPVYTTLGYFDNIPQAFKKIYRLKIDASTAENMKELLEDHKRIVNDIYKMFDMEGIK